MVDAGVRYLFEPGSVAVVGATNNQSKPGHTIVGNLLKYGFEGSVYPINRTGHSVLGREGYRSIAEIPNEVDLAVLLSAPFETVDLIEECARKKVKAVVICSGGFAEVDDEGRELERRIIDIARETGMRILGPNINGPINTSNNLLLSMAPLMEPKRGNLAFISQTGQFMVWVTEWLQTAFGLGVSKAIDLGNKCDVDEIEVLEYLEQDPATEVIAIHIEALKDGRRLMEAASRIGRRKPVIVLKTGRSQDGARAALSHSGSLAGRDEVTDAALRQAGVIRAQDFDEFLDFAKAFSRLSIPRGNRVGVVTSTGGGGIMALDACERCGLEVATFSAETIERMEGLYPGRERVSKLVDLGPAMGKRDINELYGSALDAMVSDDGIDGIVMMIIVVVTENPTNPDPDILMDLVRRGRKPIIACTTGRQDWVTEYSRTLEAKGVPTYPSPERAVRALAALRRYGSWLEETNGG